MTKIVVVGDVHEGINFGFNVDPETGISQRCMDLHNNFAKVAKFAVENKAKLFIIVGDLFDRTHVSPTFREMVRLDVIEPLGREGIEAWILAGNHDQPRSMARSTSLDDFRGYSHVRVFRDPKVEMKEFDSGRVGFLLLPYLHPDQIAKMVRERLGQEVPREEVLELGRRMWGEWIKRRMEEVSADFKILLGHYYIEGARVSSISYPALLPGEFSFTKDMIPDETDLAVFGHIHLHQAMEERIVYVGAPERIDWGEREDEKGFIVIDLEKRKWDFVRLPSRQMVKIEVQVEEGDPTEKILKALPLEVSGKMIRLEVTIEEGLRSKVDENKIASRLREAFHYEVRWLESKREKLGLAEFTLDPLLLFSDFVRMNYHGHPKIEEILEEGQKILREVLA